MIFYKNQTAVKAEDEISSAFSLCNLQGLLAWGEPHLRSLQMDVLPELELLSYLRVHNS